jgi:hypothetical protein
MIEKNDSGQAFFYVVGDPHSRLPACKIGITRNLGSRLAQVYRNERRHAFLPEGMALFSSYRLPEWQQAADLEKALLRYFRGSKADARTLGWLSIKPAQVDLAIDITALSLGLECLKHDFVYRRWGYGSVEGLRAESSRILTFCNL